jgi:hypothetical protein
LWSHRRRGFTYFESGDLELDSNPYLLVIENSSFRYAPTEEIELIRISGGFYIR